MDDVMGSTSVSWREESFFRMEREESEILLLNVAKYKKKILAKWISNGKIESEI